MIFFISIERDVPKSLNIFFYKGKAANCATYMRCRL